MADKNYWIGELRFRINELNTEIDKMTKEIESYEKDNQAAVVLHKTYIQYQLVALTFQA